MMIDYTKYTTPENWWHVHKMFTDAKAKKIAKLYPEEVEANISGKRATANEFRKFVKRGTPEGKVFAEYDKPEFRSYMTDLTGIDMMSGKLRVELVQDTEGFWLEEHVDIKEKLMTLQIYIGKGKQDWGTVIYTQPEQPLMTVPFKHNAGWLSVLGEPVLHGVPKKKVDGLRKSVIINYVTSDWRDLEQLY